MNQDDFIGLMAEIAGAIADRPLNKELQTFLNQTFPGDGEMVEQIDAACRVGIRDGWLCMREQGGIKFGRLVKPSLGLQNLSVDVVHMDDCRGPHHVHPTGEIDLILPEEDGAEFDGHGRGWLVNDPGTAHYPTVTGGSAIVVYMLPNGEIEFTRQ